MAISTQDAQIALRRVFNGQMGTGVGLKPHVRWTIEALKRQLAQMTGGIIPDLQVVAFGLLSDSETIIADAACKLYGLVLVKAGAATATFSKLTDSATTSSDAASELRFWSNAVGQQQAFIWAEGLPFANGITMQGNTTANGGTTSGANACSGFCIIGAP